MNNKCLVCGIDRFVFAKEQVEFGKHIRGEHSIWKYINFLIRLRSMSKSEYNGTEDYVAKMIERGKIGFMPIGRAMVFGILGVSSLVMGRIYWDRKGEIGRGRGR